MSDRLKLVVFPCLLLLGFNKRDTFVSGADVELEFLSIHFDLSCFLLEHLDSGHACCQLRLEAFLLERHSFYLGLDLFDLLLSILKNKQLFQFRMHAR
jgi:hypothetical protein